MESEISNYKEAFANLKLLEEYSSLSHTGGVSEFGVQRKKFKLIKKDDSFLVKIWFAIKKFFHLIKVDSLSIDQLKNKVFQILKQPGYKQWAYTEGKITKQGRRLLIDINKKVKDTNNSLTREKDELETKIALLTKNTQTNQIKIENFEKENTVLKKKLKNKDQIIKSDDQRLKNQLDEYAVAWNYISPNKSVKEILEHIEEHNAKSTIESVSESALEKIKETFKNVKDHHKHKKDREQNLTETIPIQEKKELRKKDKKEKLAEKV